MLVLHSTPVDVHELLGYENIDLRAEQSRVHLFFHYC